MGWLLRGGLWQVLGRQAEIDLVFSGLNDSLESTLGVVDRPQNFLAVFAHLGDCDPVAADCGTVSFLGEDQFVEAGVVAGSLGDVLAVSLENQLGPRQWVSIEQNQATNDSQLTDLAGSLRGGQVKADDVVPFDDGRRENGFLVVEFGQRFIDWVFGIVPKKSDGDLVLAHRGTFQLAVELQFVPTILVGAARAGSSELVVKIDLGTGQWLAVESNPADDMSKRSAVGCLQPWLLLFLTAGQAEQQDQYDQPGEWPVELMSHHGGSPHIRKRMSRWFGLQP